ncbi:MAG: hypothetical protein OXD41_02070 [Thaumarchaeota archaeon]|nr:hypothetical protein [Nitrososphaerota archaeon]
MSEPRESAETARSVRNPRTGTPAGNVTVSIMPMSIPHAMSMCVDARTPKCDWSPEVNLTRCKSAIARPALRSSVGANPLRARAPGTASAT